MTDIPKDGLSTLTPMESSPMPWMLPDILISGNLPKKFCYQTRGLHNCPPFVQSLPLAIAAHMPSSPPKRSLNVLSDGLNERLLSLLSAELRHNRRQQPLFMDNRIFHS